MHSLKIEFHPIYTKFNDFFSPENVKRNLTNNSLNCISFPKKEEKLFNFFPVVTIWLEKLAK